MAHMFLYINGYEKEFSIRNTVTAPLTDAATIQELWFLGPDCHIKTHIECVLAWKDRGAATNWERLSMARVW